ncbi:MAG: regulatory protein RecX [Candidatus Cryptobacteroides sp.]
MISKGCQTGKEKGSPSGEAAITGRLRRLCSMREYCSQDILAKASAAWLRACPDDADGAAAFAGRALESLRKDGYVDDFRYASAFARDKSSLSGWGPVKIRYALSAKRIDADVIAAALQEIDSSKASDRLRGLLEVKMRQLGDVPDRRLRLLRFALSRGYSYDEAASAIDSLSGRH